MSLKKKIKGYLIAAIVASLVISSLVGIAVLLLGSFDEIQYNILFSTLAIAVFSITSLASIRHAESPRRSFVLFSFISLVISLITLLFMLWLIWVDVSVYPWKLALVLIILSISFSHISLLLPSKLDNASPYVKVLIASTAVCIITVAGILIRLVVIDDFSDNESLYRVLGVFAILDALGTIISPIFSKIFARKAL